MSSHRLSGRGSACSPAFLRRLLLASLSWLAAAPVWSQDPPPVGIAVTSSPGAPMLPQGPSVRLPIFFPPIPPILGTARQPSGMFETGFVAPEALAPYVNERFYPALGTLLAQHMLPRKLQTRLDAFLAERRKAEAELRRGLKAVFALPPAEHSRELAGLALEQAAPLQALEEAAEALRGDFIAAGTSWNALRSVKLEKLSSGIPAVARERLETLTVLATAFYAPGLHPVQRDLLIEAAIEALPAERGPFPPPLVLRDRRVIFFQPGAARVVVPNELPEPLRGAIARYEERKRGLKTELRAAARRIDLAGERTTRKAWSTLRVSQAKQLEELDREAEHIRILLVAARIGGWPALALRLPREFGERLTRYRRELRALAEERHVALSKIRQSRLRYKPDADAKFFNVITNPIMVGGRSGPVAYVHHYAITDRPGGLPNEDAVLQEVQETVADFNREHAERFKAVALEEAELAKEAAKFGGAEAELELKQIVRMFSQMEDQAEAIPLYQDYRCAVLQPGLSAGQRRLLLGMALEELRPPPAGGFFQPKD